MPANTLFTPEKTDLRIGFLPLTDAAVLIAAQERGIFERYGLNVTLKRVQSWATIRDRVAFGELDAAHMLAPMPLAASLGIDGLGIPMQTAFSMGLNGSAITLSTQLMQQWRGFTPETFQQSPLPADGLHALMTMQLHRKLVFAHVFPFSQHYYLLRGWLSNAGIDPDNDVELRVIPPAQMVNQLAGGQIDGCCVGAPWNQIAVQQGIGQVAVSSYELWNNGPEKVLGVTRAWADQHPQTHRALVAALLESAEWLDQSWHNRQQLADWLARPDYLDMTVEHLSPPLLGSYAYAQAEPPRFMPDFNVFYRYAANAPWHSFGQFFWQQMQAAQQLNTTAVVDLAAVYRMDIYRSVAESLGKPYPLADSRPEGSHHAPWVLAEASQPIAMGSTSCYLA